MSARTLLSGLTRGIHVELLSVARSLFLKDRALGEDYCWIFLVRAFSDLRYHKSMRDFFAIRMKYIFSTSTFQTPTFQTPILLVNLILFLSLFCSLFSLEMGSSWRNEPPYCHQEFGSVEESSSKMYSASCHCGRVRYNVRGEPESSKLCHCRGCQQLHGAPFEWVSK
jgi:hypothetical protein